MARPSIHIIGIQTPSERDRKMLAVYEACVVAGIQIPPEVIKYLDNRIPNAEGVEVELCRSYVMTSKWHPSCKPWIDAPDGREGVDVGLPELPPEIKKLRFFVIY